MKKKSVIVPDDSNLIHIAAQRPVVRRDQWSQPATSQREKRQRQQQRTKELQDINRHSGMSRMISDLLNNAISNHSGDVPSLNDYFFNLSDHWRDIGNGFKMGISKDDDGYYIEVEGPQGTIGAPVVFNPTGAVVTFQQAEPDEDVSWLEVGPIKTEFLSDLSFSPVTA